MVYDESIIFYIIASILITVYFNESNNKVLLFLSLILVLMYFHLKINPLFLLLVALAGAGTEMIIMHFSNSIWKYRNPNVFNIPAWLPVLWAIAGVGVLYIGSFVDRFEILKLRA